MKTIKLFMFLMAMFLAAPAISYAQITDDDLDYQGGSGGNSDFGPVSIEPDLVKGVISYKNETITNTFFFDLGVVTMWIVDEEGNLYISEEVDTNKEKAVTIDIQSLPAKKYKIICFTPEGQQTATFEVYE